MDSFMDKLAEKFNAQEMIRANTVAEKKEVEKITSQANEYKAYLDEMKNLNHENEELARKVSALLEEVRRSNDEQWDKVSKLADEGIKTVAELATIHEENLQKFTKEQNEKQLPQIDFSNVENSMLALAENLEEEKKRLTELFEQTNEYVHRENVKVYRNVQAVVVDEMKNRTAEISTRLDEQKEELSAQLEVVEKGTVGVKTIAKVTMVFSIIACLGAVAAAALVVLNMLNLI